MPQTVLIVEDEQSAARVLSSLCSEIGLSVRHTRSGKEAQELCAAAAGGGSAFAAAIVDLVLAELDGFQFAQAARGQPWGKELPLVVVSGIYKQLPPEFASRVRPAAFFAKPFEPSALRDALQRITGASASAGEQGRIQDKHLARLFVDLLRRKATGTLTVERGETKRTITFQQGMVRSAQGNVPSEAVGAGLVAQGAIKQASFDRAAAMARQQNIALHEALAAARVLTPEQLRVALRQQTSDVCAGALALEQGSFKFDPRSADAVNGVPDTRASPVTLILEAARKAGSPDDAQSWLQAHAQERLHRSPELDRETFALKSSWPGESVTPLASSGKTVGEVLSRVKRPELPLLQYLCMSGLLAAPASAAQPPSRPVATSPPPSQDDDWSKTFTPKEQASRRMLFGERDHLKDADHYEVLGVARDASPEQIKQAYIAAAKRFHSDAFSGQDLGSARAVAQDLFARVNEAQSVLSDKERRAEHDVYLDRKAKGLPTDVGAILRAETIFQKGEKLFKHGKLEEAESVFREAIGLNHAEAEFHAYLGMTIFRRTGKAEQALPHVEKALQMDGRLRTGTLFLAQLYEARGERDRALSTLRKAIEKDPEFKDAKDAFRHLKQKPATQSKGGFLSRLLSKK